MGSEMCIRDSIIPKQTWHRGYNTSDTPSHIVEIWRGEVLEEEDIERRNV